MSKRWSKLQSRLYDLMDRSDNFQMHCAVFDKHSSDNHYKYWITTGKGEELKTIWETKVFFNGKSVGAEIERYINFPKNELHAELEKSDEWNESWKELVSVLLKFDRRFKKENKDGIL